MTANELDRRIEQLRVKEPNWEEILYDLVYLGVERINECPLAALPDWVLLQAHSQLMKRHAQEINANNHAAAYLADMKQAQGEKRTQLDPLKWKPYRLLENDERITPELARTIKRLICKGRIPPRMTRALHKAKLMETVERLSS